MVKTKSKKGFEAARFLVRFIVLSFVQVLIEFASVAHMLANKSMVYLLCSYIGNFAIWRDKWTIVDGHMTYSEIPINNASPGFPGVRRHTPPRTIIAFHWPLITVQIKPGLPITLSFSLAALLATRCWDCGVVKPTIFVEPSRVVERLRGLHRHP